MKSIDFQDALIDRLLREELGGDRPRDLTKRVLSQVHAHERQRRKFWVTSALATAAAVVLTVTLLALWARGGGYPAPNAAGNYSVDGGGTLQRGATIETTGQATVALGGYVKANISPRTRLTLGGEKFEEKLLLEEGVVSCNVEKAKGQFDILVGPAAVHVTGTTFSVNVTRGSREKQDGRWMTVAVEEGSVTVNGIPGIKPRTLGGGRERKERFFLPDNHMKPATEKIAPAPPASPPAPATTSPAPPAKVTAPTTAPRIVPAEEAEMHWSPER